MVLAALGVYVGYGDTGALEKFRVTKHFADNIAGNPRSLLVHVLYGDYEGALIELKRSRNRFDISRYSTAKNQFAPRYTNELKAAISRFLETVEDDGLKLLAETLLTLAPDLPKESLDGKPLPYDARLKRANNLAAKFRKTEFADAGLRKQVMNQLVGEPGTAWFLRKELAAVDWEPMFGRLSSGRTRISGSELRTFVMHGMNAARSADGGAVELFTKYAEKALGDGRNVSYDQRVNLDNALSPLVVAVRKRQSQVEAEEAWRYAQCLAALIGAVPKTSGVGNHDAAHTQILICASLADRMPELEELRKDFGKEPFTASETAGGSPRR